MISWVLPVSIAALLWAAHMVFIKLAVEKLAPDALVFLFYIVGLATATAVILLNRTRIDFSLFVQDRMLVLYVVMAGVTIGLVDFFFSKGLSIPTPPPLAIYSPMFTTVGLVVTALLGVMLFHEALTPLRMAGFVLAVVGIFLLAR